MPVRRAVTPARRRRRQCPAAARATRLSRVRAAGRGTAEAASADTVKELDWDALIPADWNPQALMDQYDAGELSDTDPGPRAAEEINACDEARSSIRWMASASKLPGFVVPLEMDAGSSPSFSSPLRCLHPCPAADQPDGVCDRTSGHPSRAFISTPW